MTRLAYSELKHVQKANISNDISCWINPGFELETKNHQNLQNLEPVLCQLVEAISISAMTERI
jgi:hypothetical protein